MKITLDEILLKLATHLKSGNLKSSSQREEVLRIFYDSGRHVTAEELYDMCRETVPNLGIATIYRALKLFCSIGITRETVMENGIIRYEINDEKNHHDHLICIKCGSFVEVFSPEIERIQKKISVEHDFELVDHRLNLYGICSKCKKK